MKKILLLVLALLGASAVALAAPVRVAVMDFDDQTGATPDALLGGELSTAALASKAVYLVGKDLIKSPYFTLIDRRDFLAQVDQDRPLDGGKPSAAKTTFLHAAQALNADVVLRGSLLSFSTGKQVVDQGGYHTEFVTLSLRIALEAIDPVSGAIVAMADGNAKGSFRQTNEQYTELSEDDALNLMDEAIAQAIPLVEKALAEREAKQAARQKVKLDIKTSADPAMIEIDGILVGTTPVQGLEVYAGDHILVIGKPGYRDITKRILFEKDSSIEVPMIRTELTADEIAAILEKARLNIHVADGIEPALIIREISE